MTINSHIGSSTHRKAIGMIAVILLSNFSSLVAHDVIVKRNSNLREQPTTASSVLEHLEPGAELVLLELRRKDGYYHVLYEDHIGWVWSRNVTVIQEYERGQWKHWIDADGDCQKTRDEVLIAESEIPVTFQTVDSCEVASGRWTDPYTNEVFTDPGDLDIDHLVPLKNAHRAGGWRWTFEKRKAFANDLNNPNHLVAVKNSANRSKGSRGPEAWLPQNLAHRCDYVEFWVEIKTDWGLTMTEEEAAAISEIRAQCPQR